MSFKLHPRGLACALLFACICSMVSAPPVHSTTDTVQAANAQIISSGPTPGSPYAFDVVDVRGWSISGAERYLLTSLEGIVNRDAARLFVIRNNEGAGWLSSIADACYSPSYLSVSNLSDLISYYDALVKGVVIFDGQPESANIATPICGINYSVMIDSSLAPAALAWPSLSGKPIVANITEMYAAQGFTGATPKGDIYRWAFDTWFPLCN